MLHTLAHIELNAVDLAWDTVARFSPLHAAGRLPAAFFSDFARVADDEARHLGWCLQRLAELGAAYGDVAAHNQLWEGAQATAHDVTDRLVIIPCVQARARAARVWPASTMWCPAAVSHCGGRG